MYIIEVSRGYPTHKYPLNGIFEFDQAKALSKAGHKVIFACVDVRSVRRWRKWGIDRFEKDGVLVYNFSFPVGAVHGLDSAVQKLGFSLLFRKIVKEHGRPELVHAHFGDTSACVTKVCAEHKIPYVVTEHSSTVNVDILPEKQQHALTKTYSGAARVIAVSTPLKDRIKQHTGVSAVVIPNIVDLSLFSPNRKKENSASPKYISAGNLNAGKGFDVLLRAFSSVSAQCSSATLLIMGDGPELANLKTLARSLGIESNVKFYGAYRRDEFADELAKNDIFVLASRGETFGVVYIEAMACGLPVIATCCGGPEDFVDDSNGLLIPVDDIDALCDAMLSMVENLDFYNGPQIAREVQAAYSDKAIAQKLTELFRNVTEH